ncbi:hypothetical protein JJ685_24540 [Ramlibacter monticola]|uniref:Uncharacterized protein n=1 Tax=Ramlibacter monticola TaxID=1926872 RepID=A0A936Z7E2_9BURK|nr:hypothetical protein [Ramlibacter monticola]MBL0394331.1 hypothetical protein [Ramlibacter monticola]
MEMTLVEIGRLTCKFKPKTYHNNGKGFDWLRESDLPRSGRKLRWKAESVLADWIADLRRRGHEEHTSELHMQLMRLTSKSKMGMGMGMELAQAFASRPLGMRRTLEGGTEFFVPGPACDNVKPPPQEDPDHDPDR